MRTLLATTAVAAVTLAPAAAQEQRPDGIRAGSFLLSPGIAVEQAYDSNIFREPDGAETDSFITSVEPSFSAQSDWNRHGVRLDLGMRYELFSNDSDDNNLTGEARVSGVIDISRSGRISVSAGYVRDSEDRGADDAPANAAEPVSSDNFDVGVVGEDDVGRFRLEPFVSYENWSFNDADLIGGGVTDQGFRDRDEVEAGLELGYAVTERYEAFVRGSYRNIAYDESLPGETFNRDSEQFAVLTGFNVDITRLIEGRVGVGYRREEFDATRFGSNDSIAAEAGITWSITPITTVFVDGGVDVEQTTVADATSTRDASIDVGVTHELLRNLTLEANAGYLNRDFQGIERTDDIFGAGLGAEWRITRRFSARSDYSFDLRNSDVAGEDYDAHVFSIGGSYRF